MKIVYILSGTGTLGGATKSFLHLLEYTIACGSTPLVITPNKKGIYTILFGRGINTIALPYYFNSYPSKKLKSRLASPIKILFNWCSALKLKSICKKFKPDIIHSNTTVNNIGYLAAKWMGIPHIWHIREYGDKDFNITIRHINTRLLEPNNYSIAITKDIARYRNVNGTINNRVIYNGIVTRRSELTIQPKKKYFLYAGRIEKTKGIEDCINAFISLKAETPNDIQLLIAGNPTTDGEAIKSFLIKKLEKIGISTDIQWLGGRNDVSQLMAEALATIVPSQFEGFGRVMPEAMSVGCLVIGRNTGGTKEQFDNGLELTGQEIGLRFETVEELKHHMADIINKGIESYNKMIQAAFTTVNTLYTIEEYRERVLDFYKKILTK